MTDNESAHEDTAGTPEDAVASLDAVTHQAAATWNVGNWLNKMLVDCNGEKIGKLQDVYVDVENDEPQFGTVKEGFFDRHLTSCPRRHPDRSG